MTVADTKAKNVWEKYILILKIIKLWHHQTSKTHAPSIHKNEQSCIINVWLLIGGILKKSEWRWDLRFQRLNLLFPSVTRFFIVPQNKIYMARIKKQNVLYDWLFYVF